MTRGDNDNNFGGILLQDEDRNATYYFQTRCPDPCIRIHCLVDRRRTAYPGGGNSNSTTGDFSFGIIGQYVENGEIVKPVNEMNISGNLKELLKQLVAVGNDPYPYSTIQMPTLRFEGVDFSGT